MIVSRDLLHVSPGNLRGVDGLRAARSRRVPGKPSKYPKMKISGIDKTLAEQAFSTLLVCGLALLTVLAQPQPTTLRTAPLCGS